MPRYIDMIGMQAGHWTVLRRAGHIYRKRVAYLCRCICGTERIKSAWSIRTSKSCGCFSADTSRARFITHGAKSYGKISPAYRSWQAAKARCLNPNIKGYENYGGRGITMCDRWANSFEAFYADMGNRPEGDYSLDRINNEGHYEPGNCRWATRSQQQSNKRPNKNKRIATNAVTP